MSVAKNLSESYPGPLSEADGPLANILIADDDAIVRDILARKLVRQNYGCRTCGDAPTALSLLSGESFDLLLTGLTPPESGGVDLVAESRRVRPDIAVVLLTSVADIQVAVASLKEGAYDYILKPFNLDEICIRIARALEKRRLLLENETYQRTLESQVGSRTRQLKEALSTLEQTYHSTLVALSKALDSRDADPDGYSLRVTALTARIARQMGLGETEISVIEKGVLLHDIGKIGIPDELLRKNEPLTEEETRLMHRHPEIGYRILTRIKFLKGAARLVLHHHELYDGSGYPQHLKGDAIDLGARIFAVADAIESLTSNHPSFHGSGSLEEAGRQLEKMAGVELDPMIVRRFLSIPLCEWEAIRRQIASDTTNTDFLRRNLQADSLLC
jgi:response regulator RpfG family c-di-GMP phosphodiesterase